jgi:hypothetical protein
MRRGRYLKRKSPSVARIGRVLLVDVVILVLAILLLPCHGAGWLRLSIVVGYAFTSLVTLMPGALESFRVLDTRGGCGSRRGGRGRGHFEGHLLKLRASLSLVVRGMLLVALLVSLDALWQGVGQCRMEMCLSMSVANAVESLLR